MEQPAVAQIRGVTITMKHLHGIQLHGMKVNDVIKLIC